MKHTNKSSNNSLFDFIFTLVAVMGSVYVIRETFVSKRKSPFDKDDFLKKSASESLSDSYLTVVNDIHKSKDRIKLENMH